MTQSAPKRLGASAYINAGIIVVGLVGIGLLLLVQLFGDDPPVEPIDLSVRMDTVAAGFDAPVFLGGDGEGNRYVVEQDGRILRLATDGTVEPGAFLDIRERVLHHHERGLLGLAFHPAYAQNGRFYVLYSRRDDGATSISEFRSTAPDAPSAEGDSASPTVEGSERTLLVIPQSSTMHKGGMLAFDTEGMLLVGIGDGSTGNDPEGNAQDPASLLGKLLRVDVNGGNPYALPVDNGFADERGARPEVHALGLRNPWRFSVDHETGDVIIGDLGQSDWEEIDVLPLDTHATSFGWADMEGDECFYGRECDTEAHRAPVIAYAHVDGEDGHCGVVGGYVYRGQAASLPLGTYLHADYCSGAIWAVPAEQLHRGEAAPAAVGRVPAELGLVQSFGQDDAGELYLLTNGGYVLAISEGEPAADPG